MRGTIPCLYEGGHPQGQGGTTEGAALRRRARLLSLCSKVLRSTSSAMQWRRNFLNYYPRVSTLWLVVPCCLLSPGCTREVPIHALGLHYTITHALGLHYTIAHTYNAGQCTQIYLESSNPRPPLGGRGMALVRVRLVLGPLGPVPAGGCHAHLHWARSHALPPDTRARAS